MVLAWVAFPFVYTARAWKRRKIARMPVRITSIEFASVGDYLVRVIATVEWSDGDVARFFSESPMFHWCWTVADSGRALGHYSEIGECLTSEWNRRVAAQKAKRTADEIALRDTTRTESKP
jgi:hypothetical protein